ncbi:MAG: methyltransferase domain-containing protein [Deltaproteobacteria bacterium]|nr:methyltransferase domain-containing protein [Deltaproteobacteria bacterium]
MASLIESATRMPRGQAALSWAEFLPRYLLVEERLRDRRVLEIGTVDARSLVKLHDAGAARVVGTSADPSRFDRSRFHSPSVELLAMDPGRVDFGDRAFDVILVVDLGLQMAHSPRFLEEVKRVLSPDGFCMLAFPGDGRDLAHLFDAQPVVASQEAERLEHAVLKSFPKARFLLQAPFVGVALSPAGKAPGEVDVALEPGLAGGSGRPSHVIALCGKGAPDFADRTLVELPFVDFEAMTDAAQARASSDVRRLLSALDEARAQVAAREASLREVQERLPKLKAALRAKLHVVPSHEVAGGDLITPTVLERPTHEDTELLSRVQRLEADLEAERSRAEDLAERLSQLPTPTIYEPERTEADRRIFHLERTLGEYERQIEALTQQLSDERSLRHGLGTDYADAEARMAHLRAQLDDAALVRATAEQKALEREAFLAEALSQADYEREVLRAQIAELEEQEEHRRGDVERALSARRRIESERDQARAEIGLVRAELDRVRVEAHEHARENEELRRALRDHEQQIEVTVGTQRAKEADRRAIEMAAGHLSREVETLRRRVQELRNERDTLAATSQMLLDERDAARDMARRAYSAERRVQELEAALAEGEETAERLEREQQAFLDQVQTLHLGRAQDADVHQRLSGELEAARVRAEAQETKLRDAAGRLMVFDQQLGRMQEDLRTAQAERDRAERGRGELEELLREATTAARHGVRDLEAAERRVMDLEAQVGRHAAQEADLFAARARAEAEAVAAVQARQEAEGQQAILAAGIVQVEVERAWLEDGMRQASHRRPRRSWPGRSRTPPRWRRAPPTAGAGLAQGG